jgi:ferredoxin
MALMITAECTACDACKPVCPNEAIAAAEPYVIDALRCTECVGAEDEPQCKLVCPVANCIVPNPEFAETRDELLAKYRALHP